MVSPCSRPEMEVLSDWVPVSFVDSKLICIRAGKHLVLVVTDLKGRKTPRKGIRASVRYHIVYCEICVGCTVRMGLYCGSFEINRRCRNRVEPGYE